MTKREFATLCFRLMALYFVGHSLELVTPIIYQFQIWQSGTGPIVYSGLFWSLLLAGTPCFLLSGFGFTLFVLAPGLAAGVVKQDNAFEVSANLANVRAIAFLCAGLIFVGNAVTALFSSYIWHNNDYSTDLLRRELTPDMILPIAHIMRLIFGAFLVYCSGWRLAPPCQWGRDPDWAEENENSANEIEP